MKTRTMKTRPIKTRPVTPRILALALAGSTMALGGCVTDGYGGGYGAIGYGTPYAYDGYYDGYYGPIHDGYWGSDDYFYYRNSDRDRHYRRGDRAHIMHAPPPGAAPGSYRHQPFRGEMRPQQGMKMPMWRGGGDSHGGGGHRGPGRGRR